MVGYGYFHEMSGKRDSNPRPSAWEADALPTELLPRILHTKLRCKGKRISIYLQFVRVCQNYFVTSSLRLRKNRAERRGRVLLRMVILWGSMCCPYRAKNRIPPFVIRHL